jgi:hypothetical protein
MFKPLTNRSETVYERFTDRSRKVFQLANQEALRFNHEYIGTEHILLGLIKEGSGVAATVLKNLDVDLRKVRLEVERRIQSGPDQVMMGKLPQTPRAKKVIERAMEAARERNHNYVGTEHILIGLVRTEGTAQDVLKELGVIDEVLQDIDHLLGVTPEILGRARIDHCRDQLEDAIIDQDFEKASKLRRELERMEKGTEERHKDSLRKIAGTIFSFMVGDLQPKVALQQISQVLKEAGVE